MFNKLNSKRAVENFLVAKRGVAVYNTADKYINTSIAASDSVDGAIRVADGQLGFFDASGMGTKKMNMSLASGTTVAQSPIINLVQGNENSAQPWRNTAKAPLWNRPYEFSTIQGTGIMSVTKCDYAPAKYSAWVIGAASGAGAITAQKMTEYSVQVAIYGHRSEEFYSDQQSNFATVDYTTPDYTALSTAEPEDDLIQNLTYNFNQNTSAFNMNSRKGGTNPFIAFALDTTGTVGTVISTMTANTFLPVVTTTAGVKGFYPNDEMVASIKAAAIAGGVSSASILTIDLTTAGTTTGGVANSMMLVALDSTLAFKDYGTLVKNRLSVSLTRGFNFMSVYNKEVSKAFEGQGKGLTLDRQYRNTQGQRKYNLIHVIDPVTEFPSPVDPTDTYTTYIIEHSKFSAVDAHHDVESRLKDIILIPTLVKGTVNGSANSQETVLEGFLNAYLTSAAKPNIVNHSA